MKILLYSGIYEDKGTGNVMRMYYLYKFLNNKRFKVKMTSNEIDKASKVLNSFDGSIKLYKKEYYDYYDCIIYDAPDFDKKLIRSLKNLTDNLITLDFFEYECEYVDIIINLFNHNKKEIIKSNSTIYSGVDYAILKQDILENQNLFFDNNFNKSESNILVTFGGEDPNSNTIKVLKYLDNISYKMSVNIILGKLNKYKNRVKKIYSHKYTIMQPTSKLGILMKNSDIIVCGGGTTLLEAIYIGNPIIALPQNKREKEFIKHIKNKIDIFDLNDINKLLDKFNDCEFRTEIRNQYQNFIDGKGKKRILDIIKENI